MTTRGEDETRQEPGTLHAKLFQCEPLSFRISAASFGAIIGLLQSYGFEFASDPTAPHGSATRDGLTIDYAWDEASETLTVTPCVEDRRDCDGCREAARKLIQDMLTESAATDPR